MASDDVRLGERHTPERLGELGRGLADWAARYQEVPGPTTPSGRLTAAAGIAALMSTYRLEHDPAAEVGDVDAEDVVDRAVTSGDEHAIRVAEAAFGPDAVTDPTVRAAAAALVT